MKNLQFDARDGNPNHQTEGFFGFFWFFMTYVSPRRASAPRDALRLDAGSNVIERQILMVSEAEDIVQSAKSANRRSRSASLRFFDVISESLCSTINFEITKINGRSMLCK